VIVLDGGESRTFELTIEAHGDAAAVSAAEQAVAALQGKATPEVCSQPDPHWSA
jgi:hypothetical protein